jgi:hypothetical protein
MKLITIDTNAKTIKGQAKGYMTGILYMAPAKQSGVMNVCAFASEGCKAACLYTAGRGRFNSVQEARIARTKLFKEDSAAFIAQLKDEIRRGLAYATKKGYIFCVRLNGTSDIPWESFGIIQEFPDVQFYDYTKNPLRAAKWGKGLLPENYHITFSRSETNQTQAEAVLAVGGNVAVVFSKPKFPETYLGYKVVNGDETDLRFLDEKNVIVGLKAKGDAKKDTTGFVVKV